MNELISRWNPEWTYRSCDSHKHPGMYSHLSHSSVLMIIIHHIIGLQLFFVHDKLSRRHTNDGMKDSNGNMRVRDFLVHWY